MPNENVGVQPSAEPTSNADVSPMDSLLGALETQEEVQPAQSEVSQAQDTPAADEEASTEVVSGEPAEDQSALAAGEAELEHLGQKAKVPQWVKTAFEANRELATRGSMELAGLRKQTLVERQAIEAHRAFQQEAKAEFDQLSAVEASIEQYSNIKVSDYGADDLNRLRFQLDQLRDARDRLRSNLSAKQQAFDQKVGNFRAEMKRAAAEALNAKIPGGFNANVDKALLTQAVAEGFTPDEAANVLLDARLLNALYKAHQWDNLQASKQLQSKKVVAAAPVTKPGAVTSSAQQQALRAANGRFQAKPSVETLADLIKL